MSRGLKSHRCPRTQEAPGTYPLVIAPRYKVPWELGIFYSWSGRARVAELVMVVSRWARAWTPAPSRRDLDLGDRERERERERERCD
jgi:hypothetical protein